MLLFLRKLKRVHVADHVSGTTKTFSRENNSNGSVTLSGTKQFIHVRHTFPTTDVRDEKRPDITESELILAFPVGEGGGASAEKTQLVFAFLPVRDFGFRFLLHGDFLLTAARDDIHRTRPWNTNIRNQVGKAFLVALPQFQRDPKLAATYLHYVPRKSEVSDPFFAVAADAIVTSLKEAQCIKTSSGAWCKPKEVLIADPEFQKLFPNDVLKAGTGLQYISAEIDAPGEVLDRLDVKRWSVDLLIRLLKVDGLLHGRPPDWFAGLYHYLAGKITNESHRKKLHEVSFLRLSGGVLGRLVDGDIFFPLARSRRYGFEAELRLIDDDALGAGPQRDATRSFLEKLGVKTSVAYSLIVNHIIKKHGERPLTSSKDSLVGQVQYVRDHLGNYVEEAAGRGESSDDAHNRLRTGLLIANKKVEGGSTFFDSPTALYLGHEYSPDPDIEKLVGSPENLGRFVSSEYQFRRQRSKDTTKDQAAEWRQFFYQIGVNRLPIVSPTDYVPGPELKALMTADDQAVRRTLVELIARNWHVYYGKFATRIVQQGRLQVVHETQFLTDLRSMAVPTTKKRPCRLSETYLDCDPVRNVLGNSPDYLDADVSDLAFMDAVGVVHRLDAAACIKRLGQLRDAARIADRQVRLIYRELERLGSKEGDRIRGAFSSTGLIYIPPSRKWLNVNQVVWNSGGPLLDSLYPPLSHWYREHQTFFRQLGVQKETSEYAVVEALEHIAQFGASPAERRAEAFRNYRRLARVLREAREKDAGEAPGWLSKMKSAAVFLDQRDQLVAAANDLFIDDDALLAEAFGGHERISFVAVERSQLPHVADLLDACVVPRISASATQRLISAEDSRLDESLTNTVRARRADIMRLVYHRAHPAFERAAREGKWLEMKSVEIHRAKSLSVEVSLSSYVASLAMDTYRSGASIYLADQIRLPMDRLASELCAYLAIKHDLVDAMHRILSTPTPDDLEDFFATRGYVKVPEEALLEADALAATAKGDEHDSSGRLDHPKSGGLDVVEDDNDADKELSKRRGQEPSEAQNAQTAPSQRRQEDKAARRVGSSTDQLQQRRTEYSTGSGIGAAGPDRRIEKGEKAEVWFGSQLQTVLPNGWSVGQFGGGKSPFDFELTKGENRLFVEVKVDSASFFLTESEAAFASSRRPSYIIVLVGDVPDGERSMRWLFDPLAECVPWVIGGAWLYHKEASAGLPISAWNVPQPRPSDVISPAFRFEIRVPAQQVLPTGWEPLFGHLKRSFP